MKYVMMLLVMLLVLFVMLVVVVVVESAGGGAGVDVNNAVMIGGMMLPVLDESNGQADAGVAPARAARASEAMMATRMGPVLLSFRYSRAVPSVQRPAIQCVSLVGGG